MRRNNRPIGETILFLGSLAAMPFEEARAYILDHPAWSDMASDVHDLQEEFVKAWERFPSPGS
jgi:hypothetical protein